MMTANKYTRPWLLACISTLALSLSLSACDDAGDASEDGESDGADDGGPTVDEAEIQAKLDAFPTGFTKVNDAPFDTLSHTAAEQVDVWVEDAWVQEYLTIDPDSTGSDPSFDVGAMIVKDQLTNGERVSMTVMVKADPGFSEAGDWWWAWTDASAQIGGSGDLGSCTTCHLDRPDDDFVFGVPLDNRP